MNKTIRKKHQLGLTLCGERAEDTEWTFIGSVHGLARQRVEHVHTMFPDQVTLTVRFGGEGHRAAGTFEWLLT